MSELRLSLLTLGIGFLLGLAAWEWWRRRRAAAQARRDSTTSGVAASEPLDESVRDRLSAAPSIGPVGRDPVLGSLPMVDVGEQLDSQIQADVDRYGLADADTVVLDTADFGKSPELRIENHRVGIGQSIAINIRVNLCIELLTDIHHRQRT